MLRELALVEVTIEFGLGMDGLGRAPAREAEEVAVDIERSTERAWCSL